MLVVAFASFALFTYVGDPINNMVGQETSFEDRAALRERLGLNDPSPVQFARFVGGAVKGQFGISYRLQRPVDELIAERLPATIELVIASAIFAIVFGIPLGILTAIKRENLISRLVLTLSLIGVSLPTFIIGILLIYIFSVILGWFPSFGRGDSLVTIHNWQTNYLSLGGLNALVLPATTLGLFQLTLILRLVRSEMLEVLRTDYIKFARARGLTNCSIYFGHALKNTLIPVITIIGLNIGSLIAFSIITETVFQWPGMGLLFIQAVQFADIPVMSAYLVLVALVFVIINLVTDLLYYAIDPRLKIKAS
jgi:peptide/nickel transport system permease protein